MQSFTLIDQCLTLSLAVAGMGEDCDSEMR